MPLPQVQHQLGHAKIRLNGQLGMLSVDGGPVRSKAMKIASLTRSTFRPHWWSFVLHFGASSV